MEKMTQERNLNLVSYSLIFRFLFDQVWQFELISFSGFHTQQPLILWTYFSFSGRIKREAGVTIHLSGAEWPF